MILSYSWTASFPYPSRSKNRYSITVHPNMGKVVCIFIAYSLHSNWFIPNICTHAQIFINVQTSLTFCYTGNFEVINTYPVIKIVIRLKSSVPWKGKKNDTCADTELRWDGIVLRHRHDLVIFHDLRKLLSLNDLTHFHLVPYLWVSELGNH